MLVTEHCVIVPCAGEDCEDALSDNDMCFPTHFSGPDDPAIRPLLDAFDWATYQGRRYCPECVEAGRAPQGAAAPNPQEGEVIALDHPCTIVVCDGKGCGEDMQADDQFVVHFEQPEEAAADVAADPSWLVLDGRHYCPVCVRAGRVPRPADDANEEIAADAAR